MNDDLRLHGEIGPEAAMQAAGGRAGIRPSSSGHETGVPGAGSEARYRAIFESAVDVAIIGADRAGVITDWNSGAERMFGWQAEEVTGTHWARLYTEEDRAQSCPETEMRIALEVGRSWDERWHQRRDGTRFWGRGETTPLRAEGGAPIGFVKTLRDRTSERSQAEMFRPSGSLNSVIFESTLDCVVVLGLKGDILFVSPGGLTSMEVDNVRTAIGVSWLSLWQGADLAAAEEALAAARAGGTGRFQGYRPTLKGHPKWWDVSVSPILDRDGRPERLVTVARDITATRTADRELRKLAAIVEQSTDVIGVVGADGQVQFLNAAGLGLFGLTDTAAARAVNIAHYLVPQDLDNVLQTVLPDVEATGHWSGELRFRRSNGAVIPVLFNIFPLRDADGTTTGYGIISRDLTELHRAGAWRDALFELSERLRETQDIGSLARAAAELVGRTLELTRAAYGTVAEDGRSVLYEHDWCAPWHESIAGRYALTEYGGIFRDLARGRTLAVPDVEADPHMAPQAQAIRANGVRAILNVPLIENGRLVVVVFAAHEEPRQWTADEIAFVRNVADRTREAIERRRAEQGLVAFAASLERQVAERTADRNRLWRLSSDIMLVARFDRTITAVNPAWTDVLGWAEGDLLGQDLTRFVHREDVSLVQDTMRRLAENEPRARFDTRVRHRNGSYHWITWAAVPGGGVISAVGRDSTADREQAAALREAEEQLRQSQKMEAVGQLTGGIAHDFNNLLTGITGSLELLRTRLAQNRPADAERYILSAQNAAERAASLTHRLLAFSRRQTLDPRPVMANQLIRGMEDLIRRTAGAGIDLFIALQPDLWVTMCDHHQLENALLNLCINARDAMPDGGRLTIETSNITLTAANARDMAPGSYVCIAVTDTGMGMTPDVAARAFDPFFTTKPIGSGTGLGLSMIYGFVKQSDGHVRISTIAGIGTSMRIYLPLHEAEPAPAAAHQPPRQKPRAKAGETVLIVDDEPTLRMLVGEVLEELGYTAIEAPDGPSALAILKSDIRVDLLISDVGLPGGMDGKQLAELARQTRERLNVLFITGYAEQAVLGTGSLPRGMQVLAKPFTLDVLAERIRTSISSR